MAISALGGRSSSVGAKGMEASDSWKGIEVTYGFTDEGVPVEREMSELRLFNSSYALLNEL